MTYGDRVMDVSQVELLEVLKPILIGIIKVIDRDGDLNGELVEKINEILRQ